MRYVILFALLALGAAPPPSANQAVECRLSYSDAVSVLDRLPVLSREDFPGEDEYRHTRKFDTAHLTAFGFPARAGNMLKVDAISHETLVLTTTLDAPMPRSAPPRLRAAAEAAAPTPTARPAPARSKRASRTAGPTIFCWAT